MIQLIHKYKRSIAWVFLFLAACFALSGVGLDILQGGPANQRKAIVVNDKEFDFNELDVAQRQVENEYRQLLGDNYQQILTSFNVNTRRQAVDKIVDSELIQQQAKKLGLTVGDEEVRKFILTKIFNNPTNGASSFSLEAYRGLLQSRGISARQFEGQIAEDLTRVALVGMLQDSAYLSAKDISQRYIRQETTYSFVAASYDPNQLTAEVAMPPEQELQKFYETNATDYELPARVAYDFLVFNPKDFEKEVSVLAQDIELFYSDNTAKYAVPEQAKVRSIKLLYPQEGDPKKMAAVREKATKVREEALAGTPFEALVTTYSDDLPSKAVGGSRGWVARGKGSAAFDKAVFNTAIGNISEIIEEDFGFEIVKVEDKAQPGTRSFDEVKADIEKELRQQEAPAYAAAKARELVDRAKKEGKSLSEIAQSVGLSISSTAEPLGQSSDPNEAPRGLTQQVMLLPTSERLIPSVVDSGELSVAVQVKEFKEPTTAPYEEVKDRVVTSYKMQDAKKLAESKARELLEAVRQNPSNFKKESESRKAAVKGPFTISRAKPVAEGYGAMPEELSKAILAATASNEAPTRYFSSSSEYVLAQVVEIKKPDLDSATTKESLSKYSEQAEDQSRREVLESILAALKAQAQIDIDPVILAN